MPAHDASVGAVLSQDEAADHERRPTDASVPRNDVAEPHLDVEPAQGLLEVADQRLHLQDQERARSWVPSDKITSAPIAKVIEAHLGADDPPATFEASSGYVGDGRMLRVDEPIQRGASPLQVNSEVRVQRPCELLE